MRLRTASTTSSATASTTSSATTYLSSARRLPGASYLDIGNISLTSAFVIDSVNGACVCLYGQTASGVIQERYVRSLFFHIFFTFGVLQLRCATARQVSPQPLCNSPDQEAVDEAYDEDEWWDEEEGCQEDEGDFVSDDQDDASSSEDSVSDLLGHHVSDVLSSGQDTLDNAHNRRWYSRKTLQSRYFPFQTLEHGLMLAWDSTGKKISRRKMDSLLAMISDDKFDAKNLIGFTAKKLRGLRKTLPLLTTESIECTRTVIKKVYFLHITQT